MAKGQYKKRKRANKYEEKIAIDASFQDVIKIALNMNPSILPITEAKEIVFEKWNIGKHQFEVIQDLNTLIKKTALIFPKTPLSKIKIRTKVLSPELRTVSKQGIFLNIQILAADIVDKDHLKLNRMTSQVFLLEYDKSAKMIKQQEDFSFQDVQDFDCNTIVVYCHFTGDTFPEKIAISFQIFKSGEE